jgi:hypothetical protein
MGDTWVREHWRMTSTEMRTGGWLSAGGKVYDRSGMTPFKHMISLEDRLEQARLSIKDGFEDDPNELTIRYNISGRISTGAESASMVTFVMKPKDENRFYQIFQDEMEPYEYIEDNIISGVDRVMEGVFGEGTVYFPEWNLDHNTGEIFGYVYIENDWHPHGRYPFGDPEGRIQRSVMSLTDDRSKYYD